VVLRESGREKEVEGFLAVVRNGNCVADLFELLLEDFLLEGDWISVGDLVRG
jgi:hypothetical protein